MMAAAALAPASGPVRSVLLLLSSMITSRTIPTRTKWSASTPRGPCEGVLLDIFMA